MNAMPAAWTASRARSVVKVAGTGAEPSPKSIVAVMASLVDGALAALRTAAALVAGRTEPPSALITVRGAASRATSMRVRSVPAVVGVPPSSELHATRGPS